MSDMTSPMAGKRVLITGATAGIGAATATALAQQGAAVIVVSRDRDRCATTVERIKRQTGNDTVTYLVADLSSQQSIRQLAEAFTSQYGRLDVLLNNAGQIFMRRHESVDGIEMTFALNHLGYFLLTTLLLDTLKASAPARVVSVASGAHTGAKINFDDIEGRRHYSGFGAYGQSKLANIMFTYELARRLHGTGVTANCLHPGVVASDFLANNGGFYRAIVRPILNLGSISTERGAETSVYLASSPEVAAVTGTYFDKRKAVPTSAVSYDQAAWMRLWELSERLTQPRAPAEPA